MAKQFLSHNPTTGITSWFEGDGQGGFTITEEADLEAVLEHNTMHRNNGMEGRTKEAEFWYAGEIPMMTIHKWKVEEGIDVFDKNDWKKVKQRLNSNEWYRFRASRFRI